MKKFYSISIVVTVLFSLILSVPYVLASIMGEMPPYSSYCSVGNSYDDWDEGASHAFIEDWSSDAYGFAEARANGWDVGVRLYKVLPQGHEYAYLDASASFSQMFKVTAPGPAQIQFAYDGTMDITGDISNLDPDKVSMGFGVFASDSLEIRDYEYTSRNLGDYADSFAFDYNFGEDDIGKTFYVDISLYTWLDADPGAYTGTESIDIASDFFNSAKITTYSGGISPVPLPSAAWLLGAGLVGLIGAGRSRRNRQS